ncbi:MAG: ester cyclase [Bacteroidales bacterium]|jgi:predicted SnoaL-like aldol condensation-catalyzing enzyme|nr:ester cyclase [Bacteroidales bacterium]
MINKKQIATHFLELAVKGKSCEAFDLYMGKNFIHHNAYFKSDPETLMKAMEQSYREEPNKIFLIQHIVEEGDIVAVHSWLRQNPNELGYAVMHIFRFENNKIVEMWDFAQAVPENMPNENGMF